MIELRHLEPEPEELAAHRRANPAGSWDDFAFRTIRPIIRRQLNVEQDGLCVYCEQTLDQDAGHVEHIKRKGNVNNRHLTFVYENLAHSCDGPGHCGHEKLRQDLPIEPRPGCNRYFVLFTLDGRLGAAEGLIADKKRATDSITILGLNDPALAWSRKSLAAAVLAFPDPALREEFIAGVPFRWSLRGI